MVSNTLRLIGEGLLEPCANLQEEIQVGVAQLSCSGTIKKSGENVFLI